MRSLRRDEDGFTLIELLVVIIIIGILAAIAFPVFFNQRKKAADAAVKSDLRNLAHFEEIYLVDTGGYGTIAQIQAIEPRLNLSSHVTLSVVRYDPTSGYCLKGSHANSDKEFWFDSQNGGLQPVGSTECPVLTAGIAGDSETG